MESQASPRLNRIRVCLLSLWEIQYFSKFPRKTSRVEYCKLGESSPDPFGQAGFFLLWE